MGNLMVPMGAAVGLFLVVVFQLVFDANLANPESPVLAGMPFWLQFGLFMAFVAAWGAWLLGSFRRPKAMP